MEIERILWPNDFTETAYKVLPYITSLVEKYDAEVHLLHVALDLSTYGHFWGKPNLRHIEGMHDLARRGANKKLTEFCQKELSSCPSYQVHVELGDPAEEIIKAIRELDIDLVVMPIQGLEGRSKLGNVARKVLKEAIVPVLAINPKRDM
jgi:nucleotide-binding universal stress UspA family protein